MTFKKIWHGFLTLLLAGILTVCLLVSFKVYQETKNLPTIPKAILQNDAFSNMYAVNGKLIWFLVNQQNKGLFKRRKLHANRIFIKKSQYY